jgi:hypothetical protein
MMIFGLLLLLAGFILGLYPLSFLGLIIIVSSFFARQRKNQAPSQKREMTPIQAKYENTGEESMAREPNGVKENKSELPYITPSLFPQPILPTISPLEGSMEQKKDEEKKDEIIELVLLIAALRALA